MTHLSPAVLRSGAIALVLASAACAGTPSGVRKTVTKASTSQASPKAAASATPSVLPSLGLLLKGSLNVEPSLLLAAKLAQVSDSGVRIISNNGSAVISDNGLGVISDNGLGVIANNGSNYHTLAGAAAKPVEGMWVSAIGLYDGKVLAGPVATKPDGTYQLGFLKAPARNMRIVAVVPSHEKDKQYTYVTLVPPKDASVLTNDTTRLVAGMVLDVLPAVMQPYLDHAKLGPLEPAPPEESDFIKALAAELIKIGPTRLAEIDKDHAVARGISERLVSFCDLEHPAFKDLYDVVEDARLFSETLPPENPPLLEQLSPHLRQGKEKEIADFFIERGMPKDQAESFAVRVLAKGKVVENLLMLNFVAHQDEVISPIGELAK